MGAPALHRLRAVDRDEVVTVADLLPPGATWLPAPRHTLPTLPGQPPMTGYLVLVPADRQPSFPAPVPDRPEAGGAGSRPEPDRDPLIRVDTGSAPPRWPGDGALRPLPRRPVC